MMRTPELQCHSPNVHSLPTLSDPVSVCSTTYIEISKSVNGFIFFGGRYRTIWRGATIIDLAVTRNLNVDCKASSEDELSSDHLPIKFWLNTTTDPNLNKIFKPHWKNFQQKIVSYPTNKFNPQNVKEIEDKIKRFTSEIQTAYKVTGKWVEKQTENYSHEIRTQTHIRNRLKKIAQRSCDPRDKNLYNRAQNYLRKLHYEANQNRHTETIEGLNPNDGSIWKYVKKYTKSYFKMPPLTTPTTIVCINKAKAEAIAEVLEYQFKTNELPPTHRSNS
ncbi:hypothetical protein AVEN_150292-1 [Araneus ventricosus]|uniref:Endonuclease/exonuclease/phosphatase domain-containing protein n=1 Tax=Araneus ventricosus TaxID=182803 RepID=A0A4Y2TBE6_ARAVE|nr:hypothetical protein AVEN_180338-1 [Araneus ventricosus]GBN98009.1 hypothetical protein AVEN_150292-1 [Araneus ventricosus]